MQHHSATLHCPNPTCQAPNQESHKFCDKCGTFLPKRYLLLESEDPDIGLPGTLVGDRYWLKEQGILLDTYPERLLETPEDLPDRVRPYLHLFPSRIHVPQVYGRVDHQDRSIWLLEQGAIDTRPKTVKLQPSITDVWSQASPLRQLNWLWQMAQLWEPFQQVGVAASLLDPSLLRIEGSLVRVLRLHPDRRLVNLTELGELWLQWVDRTQPPMKEFLARLGKLLASAEVEAIDQAIALLDRALALVNESYTRQVQVATLSDRGPSRSRNEDSCYPSSGTMLQDRTSTLAIVCDGVGGHEGGDVASRMAIETIERHLQTLLNQKETPISDEIVQALASSIQTTNEAIGAQNNLEQRQGRQRMGTTVVMALTHGHEIYLAHVGDSRAYQITRAGCHQVTLDDDVASREVRLGYALYRDALQQVASGSLVQALGMGPSSNLHPTIGRMAIDEDCIFLLCSDGLSDFDRIEQHWDEEIAPILDDQLSLEEATHKLVGLANTLNGHDNVTVALLHLQVAPNPEQPVSAKALCEQLASVPPPLVPRMPAERTQVKQLPEDTDDTPTDFLATKSEPDRAPSFLPLALTGAIALLAAASVGYWMSHRSASLSPTSPTPAVSPTPTPTPTPTPSQPQTSALTLKDRTLIRLKTPISLSVQPGATATLTLPGLSFAQVLNRQEAKGEVWLELQACIPRPYPSNPTSSPTSSPTPNPTPNRVSNPIPSPTPNPTTGWILATTLDRPGVFEVLPPDSQVPGGSCFVSQ
jgi:serine/threonine protein phosphatase PrpC